MRKSCLRIQQQLRALETRRAALLQALMADTPLLVGSLSQVHRTCGAPGCHCRTTPGHLAWVLSTTQRGHRRCQVVRVADVEEVQERVAAYKDRRQGLRAFEAIARKEAELLRGFMAKRHVPYK
jgi:hypothetical protein